MYARAQGIEVEKKENQVIKEDGGLFLFAGTKTNLDMSNSEKPPLPKKAKKDKK